MKIFIHILFDSEVTERKVALCLKNGFLVHMFTYEGYFHSSPNSWGKCIAKTAAIGFKR